MRRGRSSEWRVAWQKREIRDLKFEISEGAKLEGAGCEGGDWRFEVLGWSIVRGKVGISRRHGGTEGEIGDWKFEILGGAEWEAGRALRLEI